MSIRDDFCAYAKVWLRTWYKWGGDDPSGFDCSGFVIECLKAWGKFPRKADMTADGLKYRFRNQQIQTPVPGCLVFWLNPQGIAYHVEIAINSWQSIGASGGGSSTLTIEDAIRDNAFIKIRPIDSRQPSGRFLYLDPFMGE
jgi:cell wall-associated NlpC family hydrolase